MRHKYLYVYLIFIFLGITAQSKADEQVDSLQNIIANLEHENLIDTMLNTRLELIQYVKNSDYDLFLELTSRSIIQAQKYHKNWALIDVYMEVGEVLITKGIFGGALNNLNKAMELAVTDEYKPYVGWINIAIGNAYDGMFNYGKSIEFYQSALDVFVQTENTDGIGLAAINIGTAFSMLKNYEKAESFFRLGLQYREKLGNPVELAYARMYYSQFKISQGNHMQAESELKALATDLENTKESTAVNIQFREISILQAEVFLILADCEDHNGNPEHEFQFLVKAAAVYKSIDDDLGLAIVLNRIGQWYFEERKYDMAIDYADSANEVAAKSVILTEQASSLKLKADAFYSLGKFRDALEFFKAYKTINDSIYNRSVVTAISNVDVLVKTMEKAKDNQILSLKIGQDRKFRYLIIGGAICFILLILFYNLIVHQRYKKEKYLGYLLKEKNEEILEQSNNLEKLNQELVNLNNSKDKFFSIIAHDLRSPVVTVFNMVELLHEEYDYFTDEKRKKFIQMACQASDHNLRLLDNLLAWSRIQGGYLKINKSDFYISDVISENVDNLNIMADLKAISLEIDHAERLKVFADKEMITTVIRNLCSNAIKYTHAGQKIQIGFKKSDAMLEFWVLDHGIGIPKNKLDQLFEIDSQMQRNGTNGESGTGLGLQLCREFIKLHDGKITVQSEEGKGSRFAFVIPIEYFSN